MFNLDCNFYYAITKCLRNVSVVREEAKKLLSYCDLDWDPKCTEFYKNSRAVTTASLAQIRQPIYKSSISSWKNYSEHLGELIDIINK